MGYVNLPLPLLQRSTDWFQDNLWFKEENPVVSTIFLICLGAAIVILVVVNIIRNGIGATGLSGGKGKRTGTTTPRRFSIFKIYKVANTYGLDKDQTKLLEYIFRNDGVSDPVHVMANVSILDKHFKRAYRSIEKRASSDEELQNFLSILFSIRNTVELTQRTNPVSGSTRQVSENMAAVLTTPKGETFPVKVLSSKGDNLLVDCPRNTLGTPIRLSPGQRVMLAFFTKSSKGFSFDTRVVGTVDTPRGLALQLAHTNKVNNSMIQRRFKRRDMAINCDFFMVNLQDEKVGRKIERKMVVSPQRFKGTITNISLGGCAIKTGSAIQAGTRLKITFESMDGQKVAALGQVLRTNRSGTAAITLHIKFLKVPRKSQNAINVMVFEYDQD